MPPVEFDTIPRFASSISRVSKDVSGSNDVLDMGSFEPIITRSKGTSPQDDGTVEDVEVPEIDSEDETTIDKLMKDYSDESEYDSDYVPSEGSEDDSTANDFVITRSKGIPPQLYGIVNDVEIPEIESEDETTIDKIMKDYSADEESDAEDVDYVPSEDSDVELEYDSDASVSDEEFEHEDIEDVESPKFNRRTRNVVIEDVKIPKASNRIIQDVPVGQTLFASIAHEFMEHVMGYAIVKTGIKALDLGLSFSENIFNEDHVQNARRDLRAIRRSGRNGSSLKRLLAFCFELFKVNWFLGFLGLSLTVDLEDSSAEEVTSYGRRNASDDYRDDEESTVFKLMKDYDSQDDEDYVPSDCSEDSMEFHSDCSEDETILEILMMDYSEGEDSDYIPRDEDSEDSEDELEYDSEAELSDADFNSSDGEVSCEETILEKIMKDYSEEESDLDVDYVPEDDVEKDIEYDSDASITESSDVSGDSLEEVESQENSAEDYSGNSEDESEEED